jgi:Dyp-type peroxidase family
MAHLEGNDFLIRPSEVSETHLRFEVTLAPRPGQEDASRDESELDVEVVVTPDGRTERKIPVKLKPVKPVSLEFPLREIDLWEEYKKALDPNALTGYVVPEYKWWEQWPSGKAKITHLSGVKVVEWDEPLERGTELRIDFPRLEPRQQMAPSVDKDHQLVLYVEGPSPALEDQQKTEGNGGTDDPPLRRSGDIQGNILAGFNKDHQVFLFLGFGDAEPAREWVRQLTPSEQPDGDRSPGKITMTADVTTFKEKLRRGRAGKDPEAEYITAVWTNLSFTFPGIKKLQPELAAHLESPAPFEALREGAANREIFLKEGESNPKRWVLTDDDGDVDALLTIAGDDPDELAKAVTEHVERAARCGVTVRYQQRGDALPDPMQGREHFGFKDGVSQPGVEGYSRPAGPGSDQDADHPGSRIVPRKHFLLAPDDDKLGWMADGSFQAFVRFTQDVDKWSRQVRYRAQNLPLSDVMSPELLAAKLVGRWPSGTPISLAPRRDDRPEVSAGDNHFTFAGDDDGKRCPEFAHIRTQNPRIGAKDDEHRILRRGIPFGPVYDPAEGADGSYGQYDSRERGLCFNAFVANLEEQFESLYKRAFADAPDPVAGDKGGSYQLHLPDDGETMNVRDLDLRGYVANTLTLYAFAPSLNGLKKLGEAQS